MIREFLEKYWGPFPVIVWTGFGWCFLCFVGSLISIIGLKFAWIEKDILPPIIMGVGVAGIALTMLIYGGYCEFFKK